MQQREPRLGADLGQVLAVLEALLRDSGVGGWGASLTPSVPRRTTQVSSEARGGSTPTQGSRELTVSLGATA